MLFWSLPRQRDVMAYRSPGCADVLRGARAHVTDFSYMTLMDKPAVKHNMLKPVSRWPVAGPFEYWLLASSPASKVKTAIHTWYNKYTQDNYNNTHKTTHNNTHKTTTIINTIQLQKYTQDNYNNTHKTTHKNTHKTTTTINTRQLQKFTQDNYNNSHKTS